MIDLIKISFAALTLFLMIFSWQPARADGWNLAVLGGISSPTPGIAGDIEACYAFYNRGCGGFSYTVSQNSRTEKHMKQSAQHIQGLWEHRIPIRDEYHLFFIQAAAGMSLVSLSFDKEAGGSGKDSAKWGSALGGGLGFELPLADLMGLRFAVLARHSVVADSVTQIATVAGIRFGVEWLGFGE